MRSRFFARLAPLAAGALLAPACIPENASKPPAFLEGHDAGAAAQANAPKVPDADAPADPKALLETVDALKAHLKDRERDFNVNLALGNLYYDNGRYIEAIEYYADALTAVQAGEAKVMALATSKVKAAATLPDACRLDRPTADEEARGLKSRGLEGVFQAAEALEKSDPAGARACLEPLAKVLAGVHARRGNGWYLVGNPGKAQEDHSAALALDPKQPEALFFSGALLFESARGDAAKLAEGKAFWTKLVELWPEHPRATIVRETLPKVDELFGAKRELPPAHPPMAAAALPASAEPAALPPVPAGMGATEVTPELAAQLDGWLDEGEKLLGEKKWQEALDTFKRVMPLRPDGRVALGLGVALRELGKPMAERVLQQATRMPGGDPVRAKFELGVFYEKANPAEAKALFTAVSTDPKLGAAAKAKLATLK